MHFPVAMRRLDEATRDKAVEIANALLDEGMDEGRAIRIAIAKARQWIGRHGEGGPRALRRDGA